MQKQSKFMTSAQHGLVVNSHQSANIRKVKQPLRVNGTKVDTAMTHRHAKIAMPISAVKTVTVVKIHCIRDIGKIVTGTRHRGRDMLRINMIRPCDSGGLRYAG